MHRFVGFFTLIAALVSVVACGDDPTPSDTSIVVDSGSLDSGSLDSGSLDSGSRDSSTGDATDSMADDSSTVPDGCVPTPETCNGVDDDCDGFTDEGSGRELTCGLGEVCTDGSCTCPVSNMCGGECVDTTTDGNNCGGCGMNCRAGQICDASICCDPGTEPVDLLFLVDNSNSMAEEQASLGAAFPRFIEVLTTGDLNADGTPEFPPVIDIQVGVVTTDMGTGGFRVPTCAEPNFGEDGVLRTTGNTSIPGCMAVYPSFLSWTTGGDAAAYAADVACVATTGTGGCGFEQPLEAVLKAVTPSTSGIRFMADTVGHADGANAGFSRPDSVLGIVVVTDEEDCSASDPEVYNPSSARYAGDLNLRCFSYPGALHPISRFVSGLLEARGRTGDVVYAVIAGVPTSTVPASGTPDYDAMLRHPDMVEMVDPDNPTRLRTSCDVPGRGFAFPPRRLVRVAQELSRRGSPTTVQSICQADYDGAIIAIAERVGAVVGTSCE